MKLTSSHTNKQAPNQRLSVTRTIGRFGDDHSDVDNDDNEYDEGNNDDSNNDNDDVCFWFRIRMTFSAT